MLPLHMITTAPAIYATLAKIVLPENILDVFEVTSIEEENTHTIDETGTEAHVIHIHLDERDMRETIWHDLHPNGFTEERKINDFPLRDKKVVLHMRRRRWLDDEGHSMILTQDKLVAEGTGYSKEFADALKKIFGHLPDTGPLSGAIL